MIGHLLRHLRRARQAPGNVSARLDALLRQAMREEAEECRVPATLPAFTESVWARIERAVPEANSGGTRRPGGAAAASHSPELASGSPRRLLTGLHAGHPRLWASSSARRSIIGTATAAALLIAALLGHLGVPRDHRDTNGAPSTGRVSRSDRERRVTPARRLPPHHDEGRDSRTAALPAAPSAAPGAIHRLPRRAAAGRPAEGAPSRLVATVDDLRRVTSRDDMGALNGRSMPTTERWAVRPGDDGRAIEDQVRRAVQVRDDFVRVPFPRLASASDRQIAAAVESYRREAAVVDPRLAREVTLQQRATALSDLCEWLRSETGIQLVAGQSVADEKVTVFCRKLPLRDVMRQLGRPFGYTWLRSGRGTREAGRGEFKYELVQDLRSQLLEEELRNRDRNAALVALEREIQKYRPYLGLTPDESLARAKTAPPAEKKLLESLGGHAWGPIQMYFHLSAQDLAALRAGQELRFSAQPQAGERPLPPEVARGALQPFRDWYLAKTEEDYRFAHDRNFPGAIPVPRVPEARARFGLWIRQSELGRMTYTGDLHWFTVGKQGRETQDAGVGEFECAAGMSPAVLQPQNSADNARDALEPALSPHVTVWPRSSCLPLPDPSASAQSAREPRATSADVLEAFHQATGLPIVSDFYTRLYKPQTVSVRNLSRFDALNQVTDTMRLRWRWEADGRRSPASPLPGGWLQFRSTSYYDDRLKEVPNRLLARWAAERKRHGMLSLDDVVEIAQLPDAQLDAASMAEGAEECWGLPEWRLARSGNLRQHVRFLAGFTPEQRQEAMSAAGLPFVKMPLAQQQRFIALALSPKAPPLQSLDELAGATLRVEYTQPGWFQWGELGWGGYYKWAVPMTLGPQGRRVLRPPVRERTREAALQAVRRVDPGVREALLQALCRNDPRLEAAPHVVEEDQLHPTRLDLVVVYVPGLSNARGLHVQGSDASGYPRVW